MVVVSVVTRLLVAFGKGIVEPGRPKKLEEKGSERGVLRRRCQPVMYRASSQATDWVDRLMDGCKCKVVWVDGWVGAVQ
jgi:hypothetical protein